MKRSIPHPVDIDTFRSASIQKKEVVSPNLISSRKRVKTWHVTDDSPPLLPPFPLEKTKISISKSKATPSLIATRISEALWEMSIDANFDDKTATASLLTEDNVEMNISLFNDNNDGTIVEVQRMHGCPASFHRCTRQILGAAQGLSNFGLQDALKFTVPRSILEQNIFNEEQESVNALLALELVDSLLKLDQFDANRLGLESLCKLTDSKISTTFTTLMAAEVVLCGGAVSHYKEQRQEVDRSDFCVGPNVRDTVGRLIRNDRCTAGINEKSRNANATALRRLALTVFANSLEVALTHADVLRESSEYFCTPELVSSLVKCVEGANGNACDAYLAAKCLRLMAQSSSYVLYCSHDLNMLPLVEMALAVGRQRHASLQKEAEGLLRLLTGQVFS